MILKFIGSEMELGHLFLARLTENSNIESVSKLKCTVLIG